MFVGNKMPVYFDGHNLSSLLNVLDVKRGIGPGKSNTVIKGGRKRGSRLVKTTYDSKEIQMTISLTRDLVSKRREIAGILNVDEPKKLIFGDEPDKYYWAIPDGDFNIEEIPQYGSGTLTWLIEDGIAYSTDEKTINTTADEVTIVNNGNEKTPLSFEVTFTSDAESIGFVSEDKIIQFGSTYSEDDQNFVKSNVILNDSMTPANKSKWSTNVARPRWRENSGDNTSKIEGSFDWTGEWATASNFGTADASKPGYWHGPSLTYNFSQEFPNIQGYHRINFKSRGNAKNLPKCQGILEINYLDADGNFIMGFEIKDNNGAKNEIKYSFFVGDVRMREATLPASAMTEGGFFGTVELTKVGNKFSFKIAKLRSKDFKELWSYSKSYYNDTVAMLSVKRLDNWASVWKTQPTMNISLTHTRVMQINTDDDSLIPNVFLEGDVLFFDGEENKTYINDILDDSYTVVGSSQVFEVDPGNTSIGIVSDGTYSADIIYRERYV